MKWITLGWRNIWRHRRRSAMAMAIMAVGAAAVLTAIGFMLASFDGLRESTIRGGLGHLQVAKPDGVIAGEELGRLEEGLGRLAGLRFTMRRVVFEGLISTGPTTLAVMGSGVEPDKEARLSTGFAPVVAGRGLPLKEQGQVSVLLGVTLAAKLGVAPGAPVTLLATTVNGVLNAIDATVCGTFTTGVPELDARQALLTLESAQALMDTRGVSRLVVVLDDDARTPDFAGWLGRQFPGLTARAWGELAPFYGQVVTLYRNIFGVLGLIILVVVVMAVANTMLMAVTERVREMGTLLALGVGRLRVRANFAVEGAAMGLIAGCAGLALAAVLAVAVNAAGVQMPPPPGRTMPYPLVIFLDAAAYALVFAATVLTGALAAWIPTGRLRRLAIVDALRQN